MPLLPTRSTIESVGTFGVVTEMANQSAFTCVHKHYDCKEWTQYLDEASVACPNIKNHMAVSSGTSEDDFRKLCEVCVLGSEFGFALSRLTFAHTCWSVQIMESTPMAFICLDVANGYSEHFVLFVRRVRTQFPEATIIAGNVVTGACCPA